MGDGAREPSAAWGRADALKTNVASENINPSPPAGGGPGAGTPPPEIHTAADAVAVARYFAGMGLPVFLVPHGQKAPPPEGWTERPVPTVAEIEKWGKNGPSNIAARMGGGVVTLDVDAAEFIERGLTPEEWADLRSKTMVTETGKGYHIFFKVIGGPPENQKFDIPTKDGKSRQVDIRAEKEYVILPGSLHPSGTYYHSIGAATIREIPWEKFSEWFIEFLSRLGVKVEVERTKESELPDFPGHLPIWVNRLLGILSSGSPTSRGPREMSAGTNRLTFMVLAPALVRAGWKDEEAADLIHRWARACVEKAGAEDHETREKILSALRAAREKKDRPLSLRDLNKTAPEIVAELVKRDIVTRPEIEAARKGEATKREAKKDDGLQGAALALEDPEPWPEEVDGAALLAEISGALRRYVAMSPEAADAEALWVAHAHTHDAAEESPILAITSAEKRSGKSTNRRAIGAMVPRPLKTSNVSAPALYRAIEKWRPTLLMDEADTWLYPRAGESEATAALRGVANSGHTRDEVVLRCEGEGLEVRAFPTWAPKLICGIGELPDTTADRAITIRLRRRKAGEVLERLDRRAAAAMEPLRRKAWRWARDNMEALRSADPEIPGGLDDRARDNWRPLLAIADLAGGEWPRRARRAAPALSESRAEAETPGVLLLGDLRDLFALRGKDRLESSDIVGALALMEDRPWPAWGRERRPLTRDTLARLLKPYGIRPRKSGDFRGYDRLDLEDAWACYLPPPSPGVQPAHPPKPGAGGAGGLKIQTPTPENPPVATDSEKDGRAGQTHIIGGDGEDPTAPLLAAVNALAPDLPEGVPLIDAARRAGVEVGRALAMALSLEGAGRLLRVGSRGYAEGTLYLPGKDP